MNPKIFSCGSGCMLDVGLMLILVKMMMLLRYLVRDGAVVLPPLGSSYAPCPSSGGRRSVVAAASAPRRVVMQCWATSNCLSDPVAYVVAAVRRRLERY